MSIPTRLTTDHRRPAKDRGKARSESKDDWALDSPFRTVSTEHGAVRTTYSAAIPRMSWPRSECTTSTPKGAPSTFKSTRRDDAVIDQQGRPAEPRLGAQIFDDEGMQARMRSLLHP